MSTHHLNIRVGVSLLSSPVTCLTSKWKNSKLWSLPAPARLPWYSRATRSHGPRRSPRIPWFASGRAAAVWGCVHFTFRFEGSLPCGRSPRWTACPQRSGFWRGSALCPSALSMWRSGCCEGFSLSSVRAVCDSGPRHGFFSFLSLCSALDSHPRGCAACVACGRLRPLSPSRRAVPRLWPRVQGSVTHSGSGSAGSGRWAPSSLPLPPAESELLWFPQGVFHSVIF